MNGIFVIYPSHCLKFGKIPRKKEEINRPLQLNTPYLTAMGHIQFITPVCANGKVNESWHLLSQIKVHSHTHTDTYMNICIHPQGQANVGLRHIDYRYV